MLQCIFFHLANCMCLSHLLGRSWNILCSGRLRNELICPSHRGGSFWSFPRISLRHFCILVYLDPKRLIYLNFLNKLIRLGKCKFQGLRPILRRKDHDGKNRLRNEQYLDHEGGSFWNFLKMWISCSLSNTQKVGNYLLFV